ncbi:MAG: YceI family protein [Bacteroidota bacterium]
MTTTKRIIDVSASKVSFSIKKLGFLTIEGTIADFQGEVSFDENDLKNSFFNVSVSPVTIDTGNPKRDEHLKSHDFFYAKEYPEISFRSASIERENDHFLVIGELSLLNKTKSVRLPFTFQNGTFEGQLSINRLDYELGKKLPSFFVGKTVQVSIFGKMK